MTKKKKHIKKKRPQPKAKKQKTVSKKSITGSNPFKSQMRAVGKHLLEIFKDKNWITKYEVDKDDSGYYRAFGRRLQDELPNELL